MRINAVLVGTLVFTLGSVGNGQAQTIVTARDVIAQFEQVTGARIVIMPSLNASQSVSNSIDPTGPRKTFLDNLARAINADWRKTWVVTASTPWRPVPSVTDLRRVIDRGGTVSFDATETSPASAIEAVAKADGASVRIEDSVDSAPLSIDAYNVSVADAIGIVAQRTHTNWSLEYDLYPKPIEVITIKGSEDAGQVASPVHLYPRVPIPVQDQTLQSAGAPGSVPEINGNQPVFGLIQVQLPTLTPFQPGLVVSNDAANLFGGNTYLYGDTGSPKALSTSRIGQLAAPATIGVPVKRR